MEKGKLPTRKTGNDRVAYLKSVKPDPTPADAIRMALKVCEERKQYLSKHEPEHWADRFWTLDHVQQLIISRAKQAGIEVKE